MNSEEKLYRCRWWLIQKYEVEEMTTEEIARLCEVHSTTIWHRLVKFGIKRRRRGPCAIYSMRGAITLNHIIPLGLYDALKKMSNERAVPMAEIIRCSLFMYFSKKGINPFRGN